MVIFLGTVAFCVGQVGGEKLRGGGGLEVVVVVPVEALESA